MDTNYLHVEAWSQAFEEVGERPPRASIHYEIGRGLTGSSRVRRDGEASDRASELHGDFYAKLQDRGHPCPAPRSC
jgi:beta-phosphoglucomutase-like phosphatase (HAD superfamily)